MNTHFYTIVFFLLCYVGNAQPNKGLVTGIGIGTKDISPAAALHIKSANKGVLIPIVDLEDLNVFQLEGGAEGNEGLLVYSPGRAFENGVQRGFYFWNGKRWEHLLSATAPEVQSVAVLKKELEELKQEVVSLKKRKVDSEEK